MEGIAQIKLAPPEVQAVEVATVMGFPRPQGALAQLIKDMPVVLYLSTGLAQVVAVLGLLVVMGHPAQSRATLLVGLGLHLLLRARLPSMAAVAVAAEAQVLILAAMVAAAMAAHHRQVQHQVRPTQAVVAAAFPQQAPPLAQVVLV